MPFVMRILCITLTSGTLGLLVACGNKGPLYLPESKAPPITMTPTTPPASVTQQDEKTE